MGAEISQPHTPARRNDLWIQAIGRWKDENVYGTRLLAFQPSIYSKAPPPAPPKSTQPDVPFVVLPLEKVTQVLYTI